MQAAANACGKTRLLCSALTWIVINQRPQNGSHNNSDGFVRAISPQSNPNRSHSLAAALGANRALYVSDDSTPAIRIERRKTKVRRSVARLVSQAHMTAQYHAQGNSAVSTP